LRRTARFFVAFIAGLDFPNCLSGCGGMLSMRLASSTRRRAISSSSAMISENWFAVDSHQYRLDDGISRRRIDPGRARLPHDLDCRSVRGRKPGQFLVQGWNRFDWAGWVFIVSIAIARIVKIVCAAYVRQQHSQSDLSWKAVAQSPLSDALLRRKLGEGGVYLVVHTQLVLFERDHHRDRADCLADGSCLKQRRSSLVGINGCLGRPVRI
jgi:hypothetical protein